MRPTFAHHMNHSEIIVKNNYFRVHQNRCIIRNACALSFKFPAALLSVPWKAMLRLPPSRVLVKFPEEHLVYSQLKQKINLIKTKLRWKAYTRHREISDFAFSRWPTNERREQKHRQSRVQCFQLAGHPARHIIYELCESDRDLLSRVSAQRHQQRWIVVRDHGWVFANRKKCFRSWLQSQKWLSLGCDKIFLSFSSKLQDAKSTPRCFATIAGLAVRTEASFACKTL